jgi:uncharacterized membrane protein YhaH (DUF805 family)
MINGKKTWLAGLMAWFIIMMIATPAFARSVRLKDAGVTLWIFIIIGAVIVLLQLIPAAILFFSFIGTSSSMVFKRKKEAREGATEEKVILHGIEPAPVKK